MIVSCPGCETHYSHAAVGSNKVGRCSQCDERFPLRTPKRRYRVVSGAGPEDPLLAAGLDSTSEQIDLPLPQPLETTAMDSSPAPGASEMDYFESGSDDDMALFGFDGEASEISEIEETSAESETQRQRPAHPVREALGVFLLAGLGGAAGFQGSIKFGVEPVNALAMGLGLGLTLGWAWIRWAERKR